MKSKSSILRKEASFTELNHNQNSGVLLAEPSQQNYNPIKKILVADDDPAIIEVITLMLEDAGYIVYASANGQTIEDVKNVCPDLILLDVLMSGVSGTDICIKLKSQQATKQIPVIMISANKSAKDVTLRASADDFMSKPFDMQNMLQKVAKHVNI